MNGGIFQFSVGWQILISVRIQAWILCIKVNWFEKILAWLFNKVIELYIEDNMFR